MAQSADVICQDIIDARRYPSPNDADPDTYDDGELLGTIHLTHIHNDANRGSIS